MSAHEKIYRWLSPWKAIFLAIVGLGLYAAVVRYTQGLGAATHLTDEFPWGLWVGFDILVGVGLAAGGFVIAATVHLFRIEKYKPIARPSVLTAFLGYMLVGVALLIDLGQPLHIWHPIIMWNPHSVMFEVAWCVMLYLSVLALELSPAVFERLGWQRPRKWLHRLFTPLVIVGVLLSTLHQSSLGTLYVIAPDKLHPLWYTPLLPVFFFLSAIAAGLAMTIFESFMSFRAFGKRLEADLLAGMARVAVVVLGLFAVWRLQDLYSRGHFGLALQWTPEAMLFWGELGLGAFLPMALFALPRVRHSQSGIFFAAVLAILGFVAHRLNVSVTAFAAGTGASYFPSWMELAITATMVAVGFALFALAVKQLPIFGREPGGEAPAAAVPSPARPTFSGAVVVALWAFVLCGVVLVTWSSGSEADAEPGPVIAVPAADRGTSGEPAAAPWKVRLDALPEPFVFPASEDSPGPVTFQHESHVDTARPDCSTCHRRLFRLGEPGVPVSGEITFERIHEGDLCGSCHDGETTFSAVEDCELCHQM